MDLSTVKILVADNSLPMRIALQQSINMHGAKAVKTAGTLAEAESIINEFVPDCIVANISFAGVPFGEALAALGLPEPPPLVVAIGPDGSAAQEAADAGAAAFVEIGNPSEKKFAEFCAELCSVISQKLNITPRPAKSGVIRQNKNSDYNIIAIGASTGGTEATAQVLVELPADVPGIVIVQHMPAGFTHMYAERLNKITSLNVSEAKDGDRVKRGCALIAEGGKHMMLSKDAGGYFVRCKEGKRVNGHCPSVGVLFSSAAKAAGKNAIGVILTGMGGDGADGLLEMRKAGAYTIGQDKNSSVVYGMPMVAYEKGAVIKQAPLGSIAGIILSRLK